MYHEEESLVTIVTPWQVAPPEEVTALNPSNFHDDAAHLTTEARNPASVHLDQLSSLELVQLMNREDGKIIPAIASQAPAIAQGIDAIAEKMQNGGRLIYLGAGTSGRLGVLDASECPPTFRTPATMVRGVIAGGITALTTAVEGAEDDPSQGAKDLQAIDFSDKDVLVGIASSGRTPYVLGAIEYARSLHATTIGISCNATAKLNELVDIAIVPVVGPEVLSGSTRLKAGTATKIVLNMLSTGVMVKLGKTFGNLMVDLRATNSKLLARARRIIQTLTGLNLNEAEALLERCQGSVKSALVTQLGKTAPEQAFWNLTLAGGNLRDALDLAGHQANRLSVDPELLLGIDGGGTSTTALLARREGASYRILGRGEAGPSNRQTNGDVQAAASLLEAVDAAFQAARLERVKVGAVCMGLAGADRPADRKTWEAWAERVGLALQVQITSDADLVLAAGTPEGWGIGIIAGTGSIALGRTQTGQTARAGGWGPLLGDAGSAYGIAIEGLRTACTEIDLDANLNAEPMTLQNALWPVIAEHWKLSVPGELVEKVYRSGLERASIAALAPRIIEAYQAGNVDAAEVVEHQALSLAGDAAIVMRKLFADQDQVPIALAGGLFIHYPKYAELVVDELRRCQRSDERTHPVGTVAMVTEPAEGAVKLAMKFMDHSSSELNVTSR